VPFTTILNRSIAESFAVLSALPKAKPILEIAKELDLLELPLGMPLNLLESSETRRLAISAALIDARPAKPCVVIFEAPKVGLSQTHQTAIARLRDKGLTTKSLAWIEIG
jgi:excinuclease UvrABC ATPase subunit